MASFSVTEQLLQKLNDATVFKQHLISHVSLAQNACSSNIVVQSLTHISDLLDMYAALGFSNIKEVYTMIGALPDMHCIRSTRWNTCILSGIMSKNCLMLSASVFLAPIYEAWFNACWLITHMHMLEKLRKQSKNTTELNAAFEKHIAIYQQSILRVLHSLLDAFAAISFRSKVLIKHMEDVSSVSTQPVLSAK